ncbi:putative WRKY transcription factor 20 [Morus notabilis]|uniref:Putative WRKY transcription factor 20 n=1 Tax=Morus notabilis TaxID=981085 RepID=W9RSK2_9ROSA|nr:probable WRKY transcription factor 20 [Morus notabilis]EXB67429.1 putative WRKY transcription factor 20 [Morus notabilis]
MADEKVRRRSSDEVDPRTAELHDQFGGGGGGAKYKLLSPAKLPISRSPCLTIPPGLSPSSFLESPVLLSNMKAEPSPTTGSFFKAQMAQGSATYSATAVCSNISTSDIMNSSSFEFKPHATSNMVTTDPNYKRSDQSMQVQVQSRSLVSVPSVKSEMTATSNELSLLAPVSIATSGASAPADGDSDELNRRGHPNSGVQTAQFDNKGSGPSVISSDDGYNWRKYGQKHVKGSEFPRSYYKCTHPNCEVKKLFERSHDGQITEIIYKGTHDHPKPQPSRRYNPGSIMSSQEERSDKFLAITGREDKSQNVYGQTSNTNDPNGTPDQSPIATNDDSGDATGNRIHDDIDDDDPFSKRRKMDIGSLDITPVVKPIREPRVVVQTLSEVDILDDGYRWRKYGQKVVRGNPNPRSYYKCTNAGCPVRKHVERASHDPKAVITTYEGKHNHDVPTARNSSHDMAGSMAASVPARIRPEETDTISLDLGVGISSAAENRSNEHLPTTHSELVQSQAHNSSLNVVQAGQVPAFYGILSNNLNQFGSRENLGEGRSIQIPSLNHSSYPYPQNMGRILTGP